MVNPATAAKMASNSRLESKYTSGESSLRRLELGPRTPGDLNPRMHKVAHRILCLGNLGKTNQGRFRGIPRSGLLLKGGQQQCQITILLASQATFSPTNVMSKDIIEADPIVTFRDALSDLEDPPFCTGLASLDENNSTLFYRAGKSPFARSVVVFYSI